MSPTGQDLVDVALTQVGKPYRLGAEAALHDPDPPAFDCSELVQWACARVGVNAPDGTVNQFPWRIPISVQQAIATPGALLFIWKGPHGGGGGGNHVAISQGNGKTIEARSTRHGVGVFSARNRGWTHGGLVPGVDYTGRPAPPPPPPSPPVVDIEEFVMATEPFQLLASDSPDAWVFFPGQKHVYLGGLGGVHSALHESGRAKVIEPRPTSREIREFAERWDQSVLV